MNQTDKEAMKMCLKKLVSFFLLFAYVIGFVGGVANSFMNHEYIIGTCAILAGLFGLPCASDFLDVLLDRDDDWDDYEED